MTKFNIQISEDYVVPPGKLDTNEQYVEFVVNSATKSYKNQYKTETIEDGITAAREMYNSSVLDPTQTS